MPVLMEMTVNRRTSILRYGWALVALLAFGTSMASAQSPNLVIENAVKQLSSELNGRKEALAEDRAELYRIINDILLPRFDRKFAAQLVLARHWRTASEEQQDRFIAAFYNNLLHRYADGVLEFDENRIEVLTYRGDDSKKRTQVKTIVQLNDGAKVPVNYDLVRRGDAWLIFNVTIEGVSYIRNFRAELDSEIRSSSLEAVIKRLESETGESPST